MANHLFRLGFFVMLLLFGVIAVFLGLVVGGAGLSSGAITYTFGGAGGQLSETVVRAVSPAAFWRVLTLTAVLPVVLGALAVWWAKRALRAS